MKIPLTPIRFLYRAVDLYGRKVGIVCGDQRFTYAEFGERCERLSEGLRTYGVRPGDRVAYLSFNNHQLLEGYYGAPLARAVIMPLNVRLSPPELIEILNHAEARVLIFESDFAPMLTAFRAKCPSIQTYVSIGPHTPEADLGYEDLLSHGRIGPPDFFTFDEAEILELFYTSGSTGSPKGVMLAHRTVYMHALGVTSYYYERDAGVELHTIPLFHANGWGRPQTATLNGLKQVMVRRFEPGAVLRLIEQERATSMALVPTMANALLHCPELTRFDTSSLRQVVVGGAASSPELIKRLEHAFKCDVLAGYGLTETAPAITTAYRKSTLTYRDDDDRYCRLSMAGWPLIGTEIRVVDREMNDVARDMQAIGEVIVRSDCVMDGYFRDGQATSDAITNGWFHTGDMAVWDQENYIHIVDRQKDIIISGGENISSLEIEKAIFAHPAVLECAVVSAPDPKWGEVPAAIVVLRPGQSLAVDELTTFLETRIARFKLPRIMRFVEEPLPKTGTGKILKRQLREPFWEGKHRRVQGV